MIGNPTDIEEQASRQWTRKATTVAAPMSGEDLEQVERLRRALAHFTDGPSLEQLHSFLTIAANPGGSVNELAEKAGITQQSASRHVRALVGRVPFEKTFGPLSISAHVPGLGLVVQGINSQDPRSRTLAVSEIGSELLGKVLAALRGDGMPVGETGEGSGG